MLETFKMLLIASTIGSMSAGVVEMPTMSDDGTVSTSETTWMDCYETEEEITCHF